MSFSERPRIFASCHNHSVFSDGDYTPEHMVRMAYSIGHGGYILTDHDTVKGTYFAEKEARKWGLKAILGCEFSTYHNGSGVHLLGFDFNPDNKLMKELLDFGSSIQTSRSRLMFEWGQERGTLRSGCTWQDVLDDFPYNDYICNNQVFAAMKKRGIYQHSEYSEFLMNNFSHKLGLEDKVYEATGKSYKQVDTERVVKTILAAGGVPVVAHPHGRQSMTDDFLKMGVMGFETRHPDLNRADFEYYEALCEERGLYKMGGMDHSGVLGGNMEHSVNFTCEYEMSGVLEEDFMKIYERRLG